jgi:hypothetical protein
MLKEIASEYSESNTTVDFNLLEPALFTLRLIYDEKKTKSMIQVIENAMRKGVSKEIDVQANWDVEQVLMSVSLFQNQKKTENSKCFRVIVSCF